MTEEAEQAKRKEKFAKTIHWRKDANEAWHGSVHLADGYGCGVSAMPGEKARVAKSFIKDRLFEMATRIAKERGTEIILD